MFFISPILFRKMVPHTPQKPHPLFYSVQSGRVMGVKANEKMTVPVLRPLQTPQKPVPGVMGVKMRKRISTVKMDVRSTNRRNFIALNAVIMTLKRMPTTENVTEGTFRRMHHAAILEVQEVATWCRIDTVHQ